MTIIQYFAALLAMGALLAYFVRARIERARRTRLLALIFRSRARGVEKSLPPADRRPFVPRVAGARTR